MIAETKYPITNDDGDDLAWAKRYVDQAREDIARADVVSGEAFIKWLDAKLRALRSSAGR